jgi:hypothetical protein
MRNMVVAGAVVIGYLAWHFSIAFAQTGNPPVVTDVWNALVTSGPLAMLLGFILWRVDSERRQLQKERDALLERILTGLNNGTDSIRSIANTNTSLLSAFNSLAEFIRGREKGI